MSSQQKSSRFLELFTNTGRKVIKHLGFIILISAALILLDEFYLKYQCKKIEKSNSLQCSASSLIGDLGWNLFQIAITIWFVDIGLKRETIEEIQKIFNSTQATRYIKGFYPQQENYRRLIEDNFKNIRPDQEIKLLLLYEEISLFQGENLNRIRDKVVDGCTMKFLVVHPESSLLPCLEQGGFPPNSSQSSLMNLSIKLKQIVEKLDRLSKNNTSKIKGSLEVRLHKDVFSPIGYYSDSRDLALVWMYLSNHNDGHEYPALEISYSDLDQIKKIEEHFEHLWQKAVGDNLLLRITSNPTEKIDNINTIFPHQRGTRV
jgi:hypothetical protein